MRSAQGPAAPEVVPFDDRPPIEPAGDATAPPSGAAELPYGVWRPTAVTRPDITPGVWEDAHAALGYAPDDAYVRRFWVAALGSGAVADLMRLSVAAQRDRSLPQPTHLPLLIHEGLVCDDGGRILVRTAVPPLAGRHVRRLSPRLRRQHAWWRFQGR